VDAIRAVVEAAYARWVVELGMRPIPLDDDYAARVAAGQAWVAGEPVKGVLVLEEHPGHLLVDNVAVEPASQGRGVGRALLAFAERRARGLGLPEVRLYTNERMTSNVALYRRLGYRDLAAETIEGRHAVWLAKPLA
jgi:ribosomal protein S18 acetylase RimI-like enzyme